MHFPVTYLDIFVLLVVSCEETKQFTLRRRERGDGTDISRPGT